MNRVVEYANELSNGPPGREYLLPVDPRDAAIFPEWHRQFAPLQPGEVFDALSRQWRASDPLIAPIVQYLSTLESPALYHLEEGDDFDPISDSLVLKSPSHVFFFTQSMPLPDSVADFRPELLHLLTAFNGVRIGFNMSEELFMRHDSGFIEAERLEPLSRRHEEYLWGNDERCLGGLRFFDTPCGNVLIALQNGEIAKWEHETSKIETCFASVADFVKQFVAFYSQVDHSKSSPFAY